MTKNNCPHCGAVFTGLICDYCGALAGMTSTPEEQRKALEELHNLIARSPRERQVALLKNGYLPDDTAALIDAGLKCVSLMDDDEVRADRTDAAARRLDAVVIKLRLRPPDSEISHALKLFKERIDKNNHAKFWYGFLGFSIFGVLALATIFLVWYIFRR
jgi:uncharacterized Zn finger protein (UPF0148 family)